MMVIAHLHAYEHHNKAFSKPFGGQWRTIPAGAQLRIIKQCVENWNATLEDLDEPIRVKRFSFLIPGADDRTWMLGIFAIRAIRPGFRFRSTYEGEAISRAQLAIRMAYSDKLITVSGKILDGPDP